MAISNKFEAFIKNVVDAAKQQSNVESIVLVQMASNIGNSIDTFLSEANCTTVKGEHKAVIALESFDDDALTQLSSESILTLVKEANIAPQYAVKAAEQIAIIMGRSATSSDSSSLWSVQNRNSNSGIGLETLYSPSVNNLLTNASLESFGIDIDKATSDMKMSIAITLLKWHTTITPRVLGVRPTSQPQAQYEVETIEVSNLDDTDTKSTTTLVELFKEPALVSNVLTPIIPLEANDGANDVLVADEIIRFGVEANILELSIDAAKFGHGKINRTDIIADDVKLKTVFFTLEVGATTEFFEIAIPTTRGRLTRNSNSQSVERFGDIRYNHILQAGALMTNGSPSVLLAALTAPEDTLTVILNVKATVNLRNGNSDALGSYSVLAGNTSGAAANAPAVAFAGTVVVAATNLTGYSLDAKFSEENLRKSNIATTTFRNSLSYNIPSGRNFISDYTLTDPAGNAASNAVNLNNVIQIGVDDRTINVIEQVMGEVAFELDAIKVDPTKDQRELSRLFAAGTKVRPTVISTQLDFTGITSIRDADRFGDVKQRVLSFFTSLTSQIHSESVFTQQLAGGAAPVYRLLCDNRTMANVLGVPHTHNHLNADAAGPLAGEVELRIVLPNRTVLEVVTTAFRSLTDKIIMVPFIPGSPDSELNFGHNWDYGTAVGHYSNTGDGAASHRVFANVRQLPVVTNAIGAIIDIVGIDAATFFVP